MRLNARRKPILLGCVICVACGVALAATQPESKDTSAPYAAATTPACDSFASTRPVARSKTIYLSGAVDMSSGLCVNGTRISHDTLTTVNDSGHLITPEALKTGQYVDVIAELLPGTNSLTARTITVRYAAEGPITAIDQSKNIIHVMGEPVAVQDSIAASQFRIGQSVRVSGTHGASSGLIASYVAHKSGNTPDQLTGRAHIDPTGRILIGQTPVDSAPSAIAVGTGDMVAVSGVWTGRALAVSKLARVAEGAPVSADQIAAQKSPRDAPGGIR